jgi:UDP-3-O-[3-hydroxymyristoyl] N-acetylglucosamine deacetylase
VVNNRPKQHTLAQKVSCTGIGLHSGVDVHMNLLPAPAGTGIRFVRTDIEGYDPVILADYRNVTATTLGTTISNDEGTLVSTVEHLMAALWGCNIDNVIVELDAPEVPIMDGSSEPFVFLIECAGVAAQDALRRVIEVLKPVEIELVDKRVSVVPASSFSVNLEIDFSSPAIANQKAVFKSSAVSFKTDLCRARTFGFKHEAEYLRSQGLAKGGSLDNAIIISDDKILNEGGLRYSNEFVRHKILDCIGDFYLAGALVQGEFSGYRSGHELNNKLLRKVFADESAWREVQ